jgi:hypothetical protein
MGLAEIALGVREDELFEGKYTLHPSGGVVSNENS